MYRVALGIVLVLSLLARPAVSQTTFASITGTVRDPGGALVPGVAIEAIHVDSNYRYSAFSNETGNYTLPQLREGTYMLRATLAGFSEFMTRDIQLAARDERRIDIVLQVSGVSAAVEVTAGPSLIETETARIGDAKDANQLKSLP